MTRPFFAVAWKVVLLLAALFALAFILGQFLDGLLAQLPRKPWGQNLPVVSAWCVENLKGEAVCAPTVTRLLLLPWLLLVLYVVVCSPKAPGDFLRHFVGVFCIAETVILIITGILAYAVFLPQTAIISLFEPDAPALTRTQLTINVCFAGIPLLVAGAVAVRLSHQFRKRRTSEQDAAPLPTEGAPSAGR